MLLLNIKNYNLNGSDRLITLGKFVKARAEMANRWSSMSVYEPPGLGSPHQGVRATGPVCCEAERTHPARHGRGCPASASVHRPPGRRVSRPLSSPQTSADEEGQQEMSVHQRGAQQKLVPTATAKKKITYA